MIRLGEAERMAFRGMDPEGMGPAVFGAQAACGHSGSSAAHGASMPAARGWDVRVHVGAEAFAGLEQTWRFLQDRSEGDVQAFQNWEWCRPWVRHCLDEARDEKPVIAVVFQSGEPVLLLPFMLTRQGPVSLLRWLSDPFMQYGDVLSTLSGPALNDALDQAFAEVMRAVRADIVRLRHVRDDAHIRPYLDLRFRRAAWEDGAPYMDLTQFADEAAYDARYTREQRRRRRRIRKALKKALGGEPAFETVTGGSEAIRAEIRQLIEQKRLWLHDRGLYSRPLQSDRVVDFLASLPVGMAKGAQGACAEDFGLVLTRMRVKDRVISWELGFRYRGRHHAYITAHDHELTRLSPGRLHMDLSQRKALKDGCRIFDLLVPVVPHKMSWCSDVAPVRDFYLPLTAKGRAVGMAYLEYLRPWLRRIYQKLPPFLRRGGCRFGGFCQDA